MAGRILNFTRIGNDITLLIGYISIRGWMVLLLALVPLPQATALLLGISVLAPFFILPLLRSEAERIDRESGSGEKDADFLFRRMKYWTSMLYWMSSVALAYQYFLFTIGHTYSLDWYRNPALDLGLFFFIFAVLLTLGLLWAAESPSSSILRTIVRTAFTIEVGYFYAVQFVQFVAFIHEHVGLFFFHAIVLIAGFSFYVLYIITGILPDYLWIFNHRFTVIRYATLFGVLAGIAITISIVLTQGILKWPFA